MVELVTSCYIILCYIYFISITVLPNSSLGTILFFLEIPKLLFSTILLYLNNCILNILKFLLYEVWKWNKIFISHRDIVLFYSHLKGVCDLHNIAYTVIYAIILICQCSGPRLLSYSSVTDGFFVIVCVIYVKNNFLFPIGVTFGVEKNEIEAKGLSFYIDAVKKPWNRNYQMYSYVNEELPSIIEEHFNVNKNKQSIMGHRYTLMSCSINV